MENELLQLFTSYWHYLAVQTACKLSVFDCIAENINTIDKLCNAINTHPVATQKLMSALEQYDYVAQKNDQFHLTSKGELLTGNHNKSLKNACILWGDEHLTAWQNLEYTLKTNQSSFEYLYHSNYFDYLNTNPQKLENYHLAMMEYAKIDYVQIADIHDFSAHHRILDVGGGLGTTLSYIVAKHPEIEAYILELENVVGLSRKYGNSKISYLAGNFFEPLPITADAILLCRVLHDWNNNDAIKILHNCIQNLDEGGTVYIAENLTDDNNLSLLTLNMMVMCNSYERSLDEYAMLLNNVGLQIIQTKKINTLQTLIIAQR